MHTETRHRTGMTRGSETPIDDRPPPSILIVEDERVIAKDLQQMLSDMGYDVFATAASAEEALARAAERTPDVVLMDIRIRGDRDGIQAAGLLRRRYPVIIIYLTAHADGSMIDRAKRTEPHGYLVKPVKEAELRSVIEIGLYKRELETARASLRTNEHRLTTITDNVPMSIGYFDPEGRVQFANRVFRELAGYGEDAVGVSSRVFLGDGLYQESYRARQRALTGETVTFVAELDRGGGRRHHEVTYLPDRDTAGEIVGVYALGYEVTEREQLGSDLRQARADLESILHTIPASITSWRADCTNRFANQAAASRFALSIDRAAGMHVRDVVGEDTYSRTRDAIDRALRGSRSSQDYDHRHADGTWRHYHDEYVPEVRDSQVVGFYALSVDLTELRQTHGQVRDLALRLTTVREEERRAVAVTLHDGIAQDLFALKLGLDHLTTLAKRRVAIRRVCEELSLAVRRCMEDIRHLANELRPVALAYAGVATVIRDHAHRFGTRSHLSINVHEPTPFPRLDEATQLLFFRAAQEALTNVARHAHASTVDITLEVGDGRLSMEVSDDGAGIAEGALSKAGSLGLLGLRERFEAHGGALSLQSREPQGTLLKVHLPAFTDGPS